MFGKKKIKKKYCRLNDVDGKNVKACITGIMFLFVISVHVLYLIPKLLIDVYDTF